MIDLKFCRIEFHHGGATTHFPDGTFCQACPHDTPHYSVISHRLGYGDDRLRYCQEHEACHAIVAEWFSDAPSHVLWALAHGHDPHPRTAVYEEVMAQTVQRFLRANERPIVADVDWDALKAFAFNVIESVRGS